MPVSFTYSNMASRESAKFLWQFHADPLVGIDFAACLIQH